MPAHNIRVKNGFTDNKLLKPCLLFFIQTLPHILCVGVKKYRVPKIENLAPIELCVKWCGMNQCFLLRSQFTPCVSMEGGLSVMGDCLMMF